MSRYCAICTSAVSTKKPAISCDGLCKKQFHIACIGVSSDLPSLIKEVSGLSWRCSTCSELHDVIDRGKILDMFQEKITDFFSELNDLFISVKHDVLSKAEEKLEELKFPAVSPPKVKPSYSSVLCNSSKSAVVVKPKSNQDNKQTKSDIMNNVIPADTGININKIKHIRDGGLLLSCQSSEENSRLKKLAQEKLSENYEIREVKGLHPRIRIVGLSEKLDPESICKLVVKQNNEIISSPLDCKVVRIGATKKKADVFQATLQLNIVDYNRVIENGYLLVGLDICKVYDAIEIMRCYKCNGFNHSKFNCKNAVSCPKCSLSHDLNTCPSDKFRCVNCSSMKEKSPDLAIDLEHAAWDHERCHAFKMAVSKLKSDLGYQ